MALFRELQMACCTKAGTFELHFEKFHPEWLNVKVGTFIKFGRWKIFHCFIFFLLLRLNVFSFLLLIVHFSIRWLLFFSY